MSGVIVLMIGRKSDVKESDTDNILWEYQSPILIMVPKETTTHLAIMLSTVK